MTGETPVYVVVADQLEAEIKKLPNGGELPSENELARTHDINRLTARAALEELERRYLVRRQKGRRTVVARRIPYVLDPAGAPGWTKSVRKAGATPRTEIDVVRLRTAPAPVRKALDVEKEVPLWYVGRRRYVDDELTAYTETWVIAGVVPDLAKRFAPEGSMESTLRALEVKTKASSMHCELVVATTDLAEKLEAPDRPLVFALTSVASTKKKRFAYSTTWLRADVFNVVFETGRTGK